MFFLTQTLILCYVWFAVEHQPRAIYAWVSNTERSSYYSLSVAGHTFYRLNYPLRLNRWYHTCQSWNGRTGEWQIWVNAERVGRGFHNRVCIYVVIITKHHSVNSVTLIEVSDRKATARSYYTSTRWKEQERKYLCNSSSPWFGLSI